MANQLDKYENLAGVKVDYQDGNLTSGNAGAAANTQSILFLGSAVDGPVGEPVSIRNIGVKEAEKMFGGLVDRKTKVPHSANLVRAMWEALRAGNEDIRLMRIDGKAARTELKVKDIARSLEQFLDYAAGNTAFSLRLPVPEGGSLVQVTKVESLDVANAATVLDQKTVVDLVDKTANAEKVQFFKNKMRPGNKVRASYDFETRSYTLVPKTNAAGTPDYTDVDYTLSRDAVNAHYFYSARKNWSKLLQSGHVPVVTVVENATGKVNTISSTTPTGDYIFRVGKGDTPDPLKDVLSDNDYKNGGILFTAAYDAEVAKGTYPDIKGDVTVKVEYAWYVSVPGTQTAEMAIPGQSASYNLDYTPVANEFKVYYLNGTAQVFLAEATDYSLSMLDKTVTLVAGAAPVGAQLFAVYKTQSNTAADPKLVAEGRFPGEVYGSLANVLDQTSIQGVQIEISVDPSPENAAGTEKVIRIKKPEEKRLTSKDFELLYTTLDLKNIKTLRQFVNYVNNDPMNNVVRLHVENEFGDVPVQGLQATGGSQFLGEEAPGILKQDPAFAADDKRRFPWIGDNGLFDPTSQEQMQNLYDKLGGRYELTAGKNPVLVEQGVYSKLENYVVDEIVLLDAYANSLIDLADESKNFATQLAQHCAIVTAKTWETIATVAVAPAPKSDLLSLQDYINALTGVGAKDPVVYEKAGINPNFTNDHAMYDEATNEQILDDNGDPIDIGRYVSVVVGPEVGLSHEKIGGYVTSGATVYAALISTLPPEVSTTNRNLPLILGLRYDLSEAQHNQLVGGRYVTFQKKTIFGANGPQDRFVVKDGVTGAQAKSDYTRLSTLRITHASVQLIRRKADPFIGLPNGLAQKNALSAEIQAGLDKMKELGVLQSFKFTIFSSAQDKVLGNAFISLELVPQFETRRFFTSVVLKAA